MGIHVKGADELEKMPQIGTYVKSPDFLNGRYYWTMENTEQKPDFKPFYIQWVEDNTGLYLWCIGSQKNRAAAAIFSNDEWHSTKSKRMVQLEGNNSVEIGKRRHDINGYPGTGKKSAANPGLRIRRVPSGRYPGQQGRRIIERKTR